MRKLLLLLLFEIAVLGSSISVAADEKACVDLLGRAIEYRHSSLRSARIVILEKTFDSVQNAEFLFTVALDGNSRKVSRKSRREGGAKWAGPDQFVLNDNEYIQDTGASNSQLQRDLPSIHRGLQTFGRSVDWLMHLGLDKG